MKKKVKVMLSLGCLAALCMGAAGCESKSYDDQMAELGKTVSVNFDPNGGKFMGRDGVSVKDYFNPSHYEDSNGDGKVEISLIEPTDSRRPTGTGTTDSISLTKAGSFFAGWYRQRTVKVNEQGDPIDEKGNALKQTEGGGYVLLADQTKVAEPAYEYDGYWDFQNDVIEYTADDYAETDGKYTFTLYAGWVSFYQFEYYHEVSAGVWEAYGTTSFDYNASVTNEAFADMKNLYLPTWQEGVMKYEHSATYTFPSIEGKTFLSAYTDESCTQPIVDVLSHFGDLDREHAKAINPVQKIYVKFEDGVRYKIQTAQQLANNGNSEGIYEILADLDFANQTWPVMFTNNTFTGKFESVNGAVIRNVTVAVNSESMEYGGLFGQIGAGASLKNITFENVTFDLKKINRRTTNEAGFGMVAGFIDDRATVENVTIGGTYKIGAFRVIYPECYQFAITANGNSAGITASAVTIILCGEMDVITKKYIYYVNFQAVTVENGLINLEFTDSDGLESEQNTITINA